MSNATQLRRAAVALVVAAALWFGEGRAAAQARPASVSQLWLDVTDDATRDEDAGVGRTGDVLELDAPSGVSLMDSGVAVLTADASGVTLSGDLELVNLTLTGDLDAVGGTFSGNVGAVDGSFSGDVDAVNLVLSGTLTGFTNAVGTGNIVLATSPTLVTPTLGAASATSLVLSGTLTGATNVSGTGNFALVNMPTFVTPVLGAATGTSLDVTGEVQGDSFSINGTTVIDDARETYFVTGGYSGTLSVGSLSSSGSISGTTGTFSGNLGTTSNLGAGTTSPSRKLHAVIGAGTVPGETVASSTVAVFQNNDDNSDVAVVAIVGGNSVGGQSLLAFGDADDENRGQIAYSHQNNDMQIRTNGGSTALTIDSSGLVTLSGSRITVGGRAWIVGSGSPEGVITASVGALYSRTDGGASTTLYVKESGTGNTGWAAK